MPPASHPHFGRPTTSVLVAVALVSGGILLLGDRLGAATGGALTQPVRAEGHVVACVADESMRLIDAARDRCRPDELELTSMRSHPRPDSAGGTPGPAGPPGPPGRPGADGVSGFEVVTTALTVPGRQAATGEVRCPTGKAAVGGGVLPGLGTAGEDGGVEDHMNVVATGPLVPDGADSRHGWAAIVKNTSRGRLSVFVAGVCVTVR